MGWVTAIVVYILIWWLTLFAVLPLWVTPAELRDQVGWLADHGWHAVTLGQVASYWRNGVPLPERGDWAGALPDRIRIFRLPLVESFPDPAELEAEIRITVLHEVAHYFGLDEDRLDELGFS